MKLKYNIIIFLCLMLNITLAQQQTVYTNFMLHQYLYNPAYGGVIQGTQFNLGYRNQWVGFDGAPKTYVASGYGNLKKRPNMVIGGLLLTERIGLLQRTSFYGSYGYHLKINKKAAIAFALGLGGVQYNVKVYDARPYDKDDAFMTSEVLNAMAFDANAGFHFYTKNFFLGFSNQHMPNGKIHWDNTIGRLTAHYYAYTGYNFALNKKREWIIQPTLLARTASPAPYQLEFHLKLLWKEMIWIGGSYRQNSSSSWMLGCNINQQFTFGYSYDFTLTELNHYSAGSHELMLSYLIPFKKKKSASELIKDADEEELNKIDNSLKTNLRSKKKKAENTEEKKDGEAGKKEGEEQKIQENPDNSGAENKVEGEKIPESGEKSENSGEKVPENATEADKTSTSDGKPETNPDTDNAQPKEEVNKEAEKTNEEPK